MKKYIRQVKYQHIVSALAVGGIALALVSAPSEPLFNTTDQFVLLAKEKINFASDITVSSGDIGVNSAKGSLDIGPKNILTSSLFGSRLVIGPNSIVNGNAFFDKLTKAKDARILGQEEETFQSPLVDFPAVPDFPIGNQRVATKPNEEKTISPGNFKDINIAPSSKITLNQGTYNTEAFTIGNNSILIFTGTTTINIKKSATIGDKVLFSPPNGLALFAIKINSQGKELKIGNESITSGIIIAPDATLTLGARTLHRGQLIAKHINIGKEGVLSREAAFIKQFDINKVIEDQGVQFVTNEVVIVLSESATLEDIQEIVDLVDGRMTGFLDVLRIAKIELPTSSVIEQRQTVEALRALGSPFVIDVGANILSI